MRDAKLQRLNYFKFLIVILLFSFYALRLLVVNAAAPDELKISIEQKTQELQQVFEQIKETQNKIEETQKQNKTLNKEVQRLDYNVQQLNLGIRSSEINIKKLGLELESLQYDIKDTKNGVVKRKETITLLLRRLQQKDNEGLLLALLKSQSLSESVSELQAIADLNKNLALEIENLNGLQNKLQTSLTDTNKKKSEVELENNNLKYRKDIVSEQKTDRQILLAQTKNQEKLYQQQLTELEKRQAEIGAEIEKIEEQLRLTLDPSLIPTPRPGILLKPINGILTQKYGKTAFASVAYQTQFHNGVDWSAPIGTPVFAVRNGKVEAIGDNGRVQFGKFVVIEHDNNLTTLYAHLSKQVVSKGGAVKAGDLIGYSGNTGYTTGPHLHFTVYISHTFIMKSFPTCQCGLVPVGATLNPLDYL